MFKIIVTASVCKRSEWLTAGQPQEVRSEEQHCSARFTRDLAAMQVPGPVTDPPSQNGCWHFWCTERDSEGRGCPIFPPAFVTPRFLIHHRAPLWLSISLPFPSPSSPGSSLLFCWILSHHLGLHSNATHRGSLPPPPHHALILSFVFSSAFFIKKKRRRKYMSWNSWTHPSPPPHYVLIRRCACFGSPWNS